MNNRTLLKCLERLLDTVSADVYTDADEYQDRIDRIFWLAAQGQALSRAAHDRMADGRVWDDPIAVRLASEDKARFAALIDTLYEDLYDSVIEVDDILACDFVPFSADVLQREFERGLTCGSFKQLRESSDPPVNAHAILYLLESLCDELRGDVFADDEALQKRIGKIIGIRDKAQHAVNAYRQSKKAGYPKTINLDDLAQAGPAALARICECLNEHLNSYLVYRFDLEMSAPRLLSALEAA